MTSTLNGEKDILNHFKKNKGLKGQNEIKKQIKDLKKPFNLNPLYFCIYMMHIYALLSKLIQL